MFSLLVAACLTSVAAQAVPYYDPRLTGGSMLTFQNEPINIIVSALSSPEALTDRGLYNYGNALGYADDCLGMHLGGPQAANLGDGNGYVNQTQMLREDFGSTPIGTCLETLIGGNHYRVFRQNGSKANSGALFLAASKEDPESYGFLRLETPEAPFNSPVSGCQNFWDLQTISFGPSKNRFLRMSIDLADVDQPFRQSRTSITYFQLFNVGPRDEVVAKATGGVVSFSSVDYTTTVEYVSGLLPPGAAGINHNISIDGQTAILTITASTVNSGIDCKGSSLCGILSVASCDAAKAKIVNDTIYRTDVGSAATGVCSGHCGLFVQGTNCKYSGAFMIDAYNDIRAGNCQKCGSKRYLDGCQITMNYVSSC